MFNGVKSKLKNTFQGRTPLEAIRRALAQSNSGFGQTTRQEDQKAVRDKFNVFAGPLFWGPWQPIWTQYGVVGPNASRNVSSKKVSFKDVSRQRSTFDVEFKGGDKSIRTMGPGSQIITITGNVATTVYVRFKSHSPYGLNIEVRLF